MRIAIALGIAIIFIFGCGQQGNKLLEEHKLYGKVKKVVTTSCDREQKFGEWVDTNCYQYSVEEFNEVGEQTLNETYNNDGNLYNKNTYKYDEKYRCTERTNKSYGDDSSCYIYKFVYNEKDQKESITTFKDDEFIYKGKYEYYENGKLKAQNGYDPEGSFTGKYLLKYDDAGNLESETKFDDNGEEEYKDTYEYDEKGNMLKKVNYDEEGDIGSRYSCSYDAFDKKGNWTIKRAVSKYPWDDNDQHQTWKRTITYH